MSSINCIVQCKLSIISNLEIILMNYLQISFVQSFDLSYEECNSFGLDRSNLLCSSCDLLKEFELNFLE